MNFQLVFIIDNGELLHYAKVHGTFTEKKKKEKKKKKKKKGKWNAAWDNYSAQKCVQIWVDHDAGIHPLTVFTN